MRLRGPNHEIKGPYCVSLEFVFATTAEEVDAMEVLCTIPLLSGEMVLARSRRGDKNTVFIRGMSRKRRRLRRMSGV